MISKSKPNDPVLDKIVRRLIDELNPDRIYLFGSTARGENTADSDYDLMVVVDDASEPSYRLSQRAHGLIWGLRVAADILVWTKEAFDSRTHLKASLPSTILREGKLLYAA